MPEFIGIPEVKPAGMASQGKFYVSGVVLDEDWHEEKSLYLHSDGQWRLSTRGGDGTGDFTSYFDTKDAAERALADALATA